MEKNAFGMPSDPFQGPEWKEYARHALRELIPKVRESEFAVQLVPREPRTEWDIKFCLELGVCIMLDKPILAMVHPGTQVPDHLVRVADMIVEIDREHPDAAAHMANAVASFVKAKGLG